MKRTKNKPVVDCLALKRRAQARIYAATRDLSAADQIAYFRDQARSGALGVWWRRVSSVTTAGAVKTAAVTVALTVRESSPRYSAKRKSHKT